MTDKLALHGGPQAKPTPYTLTNRYGEEEIVELRKALESGKLMGPAVSSKNSKVNWPPSLA